MQRSGRLVQLRQSAQQTLKKFADKAPEPDLIELSSSEDESETNIPKIDDTKASFSAQLSHKSDGSVVYEPWSIRAGDIEPQKAIEAMEPISDHFELTNQMEIIRFGTLEFKDCKVKFSTKEGITISATGKFKEIKSFMLTSLSIFKN